MLRHVQDICSQRESYILRLDGQFDTLSGLFTWSGVYLLKDINPISCSSCVTGEALLRTLVTLFTYLMRGPNILLELREHSICHQL